MSHKSLTIDTTASSSDIANMPETESPLHNWVNSIYPDFYHWMVNREIVQRLAKKKLEASSPVNKIVETHENSMNSEIETIEHKYQDMISWIKYHLLHVTRLISYFRRVQRQCGDQPSSFMFHSPRMYNKKKSTNPDVGVPVMSQDTDKKTTDIMKQYQTLLFLSNNLGLQKVYDRCLRINEKNPRNVMDMLKLLETKKRELDSYYEDHFKILKANKKQIRQDYLAKIEKDRDEWISTRIESEIDTILRTQYRHGPKIEQEGMTIDNCWKEELVDFHRRFWDVVANEKFETFEQYMTYLKSQW